MQILVISDFPTAIEKAKEILYEKVDKKTVLFLSGGATPKSLYTALANDKIITPAAVGMVDERFGKKLHTHSNELMLHETGLLDYVKKQKVPFYPIIGKSTSREKTAYAYDKTARDLFFHFPKSVAVMGIGIDGHISSLAPNRKGFIDPMFADGEKQIFVSSFRDMQSDYKERIGMTFAGLSLIDYFVVLVFGKEKKKPLQKMFTSGSLEVLPARFFPQHASNNTIIITDQQV